MVGNTVDKHHTVDVLIVGGGLVGMVLALALKNSTLKVAIVEPKPFVSQASGGLDGRSFALSLASIRILRALGVWQRIKPFSQAIKTIHVSEKGTFGATRLKAIEHQLDAFGAVVENDDLMQVFTNALSDAKNITWLVPGTFTSLTETEEGIDCCLTVDGRPCIVHAQVLAAVDGVQSTVRQSLALPLNKKNYQQSALVTNIQLSRPHQYVAYERFMGESLMAMLPLARQRSALVWANSHEKTNELVALSDDAFIDTLQTTFGYRLGRFVACGQRFQFPLSLSTLPSVIHHRVVFLGAAAHNLHPIAGQGFNLGLRDVAFLAESLLAANDSSMETTLQAYQSHREQDSQRITGLTDKLVNIFSLTVPLLSTVRGLSLAALDILSPLQTELVYYGCGFSDDNARLVAELPIEES